MVTSAWVIGAEDTHPEEDVLGGVEAGGVDARRVGGAALTHDAAGVAGDGALCRLAPVAPLHRRSAPALTTAAARCVGHNEVDHALCGPANLCQKTTSKSFRVNNHIRDETY